MKAYPDTSFLFSLYVRRGQTASAQAHVETMKEPIHIGSLLQFEFVNALRLAAFRKVMPQQIVISALAAFEADVDGGIVVVIPCAWETVHREAERLSQVHTLRNGHRGFDILHVAAALTLGADEFLSFDATQRKLAVAEGLTAKP